MIEDAAEEQPKALEALGTDQQLKPIRHLFSKGFLTAEDKNGLEKIKKI